MDQENGAVEVVPQIGALEAQTRGEIDVQIVTAKRYPRSVSQAIKDATSLATLSEDVAEQCFYALPRDGKTVEGPSARLAEIIASCWGHMRVEARVVDEDERFVTARGTAWDLQRNVAIAYESRRRITNKSGKRYNDDMVGVTSNAASSIALRNAVLKVVPKAFWQPVYEAARKAAVGTAETLVNKRAKSLQYFSKLGVDEKRVLAVLGVKGLDDVGLEELATLKGLATAIRDGDTTIEQAFPVIPKEPQRKQPEPAPPSSETLQDRPSADPNAGGDAPAAADPPLQPQQQQSSASPTSNGAQKLSGLITHTQFVTDKKGGYTEISMTCGQFMTRDDGFKKLALELEGKDVRVHIEFQTVPSNGKRVRLIKDMYIDEPGADADAEGDAEQQELLEGGMK